ncbi:hypothetical protein OUZ56_010104 [Daphnia magna]|uniref:Guanylate cyclase domain-containing protein n=1 Tax=Daphnia magna TaxID=35525 RepID=A0ABR0AHT0_9CRUS|nr:hypothetical protein OUZ56_010104 [Daphnia magna]
MPSLPIKSIDSLCEFEEQLENDDIFFELVRIVKMIGGLALSDAVKRAWRPVLSLEFRADCNSCGKKRNGIRKMHSIMFPVFYTYATELEVETKSFFKHSPERVQYPAQKVSEISNFHIRHQPGKTLKLRIGIHSSPCVAGVV